MITELGQKVSTPQHNKIIGSLNIIDNSQIVFRGKGNILFIDGNVRLSNTRICFCGNNALIYLSSNNKHIYKLKIDAWSNTTIFFGNDNYFNQTFSAIISERQNLIVGSNCIFSFGIWLRTADPHILYDAETKKRINKSKSILIGDHVWIGQNATVLKGTNIGSGSVISANCVLSLELSSQVQRF